MGSVVVRGLIIGVIAMCVGGKRIGRTCDYGQTGITLCVRH